MTAPAPRASVLIPVWNGVSFIDGALDSALSQSLDEIEVIVIDDASTDGTAAHVAARAARDPRLHLLRVAANGGPGAARSLGLQQARGEWIAILDADDRMAPDRLESLIAEAERDGLDAIADNLALVDPGLGTVVAHAFPLAPSARREITVERFLDNVRPAARVNLGWMQPVMRRDFLTRHGIDWPPLRHAEDMVFTMRLLQAGAVFRLVGRPSYRYTQRRGTQSGTRSDASRTRRSITEQQRALDTILAEGTDLSPRARRRLVRMRPEIAATAHALDVIEALDARAPAAALMSQLRALATPRALWRCLRARYVVGRTLT